MRLTQVSLLIACVFYFPISLYPVREKIFVNFKLRRSKSTHFFITFILSALSVMIAWAYPNIMSLFGILGGLTIGSTSYYLPIYLKLISLRRKKKKYLKKAFYFFLLVVIKSLGIGSAWVSVVDRNKFLLFRSWVIKFFNDLTN